MGERPAAYGLERDAAKKIAELERQLAVNGLRPADLFFSLRANGATWEYICSTYGLSQGTILRVCANQEVSLPQNDQATATRAGNKAQERYGGSPGILREMWYKLRAQGINAKARPGYRRAVELTGEQWELEPHNFIPDGGSRCSFVVEGQYIVFDSPEERDNGLMLNELVLRRMGIPGLVAGETFQVPLCRKKQPYRADFRIPHVALIDFHKIQRDEREAGIRNIRQLRDWRAEQIDRPELISHHYIMYDETDHLLDILNEIIFPELARAYPRTRMFNERLTKPEFKSALGIVREQAGEHDIFEDRHKYGTR